jgi:hypothetical protein
MLKASASSSSAVAPATTLKQLLDEHDSRFVRTAYLTLLGRPVDPDGLNHYLTQIRRGLPKLRILDLLSRSGEAKAFGCRIPGLSRAIRLHRMVRLPVIGPVIRLIGGLEGDGPSDRQLRRIENQFFALDGYVTERFDALETALARIGRLSLNGSAPSTRQTPSITDGPALDENFTPRAREIYRTLKTWNSEKVTA